MKSISKLKDEARKYEQREEWEKAIQAYLQVLKLAAEEEAEVELPLYNRLGDLCVRMGKPQDAVRHYEQAADRYAEAGLYNNAIALCNKALRYNPDRPELIRKLGQFSASQGFITDARRYFLDYAERQFRAGKVTDALNALEDFANISDDPEVRELLGRQLAAHGRVNDAVDELKKAYAMRVQEGNAEVADRIRQSILAIDPRAALEGNQPPAPPPAPPPTPRDALAGLPGFIEVERREPQIGGAAPPDRAEPPAQDMVPIDLAGFETTTEPPLEIDLAQPAGIEGLETTVVDFGTVEGSSLSDLGIEPDQGFLGETGGRDAETFELPEPDAPRVVELPAYQEEGSAFELPLLEDPAERTPPAAAVPPAAPAPRAPEVQDITPVPKEPLPDLSGFAGLGGELRAEFSITTPPDEADIEPPLTTDLPLIEEPAEPASWNTDESEFEVSAVEEPDLGLTTWEPETPTFELPEAEESIVPPIAESAAPAADVVHVPAIELPTWDTEPVIDEAPTEQDETIWIEESLDRQEDAATDLPTFSPEEEIEANVVEVEDDDPLDLAAHLRGYDRDASATPAAVVLEPALPPEPIAEPALPQEPIVEPVIIEMEPVDLVEAETPSAEEPMVERTVGDDWLSEIAEDEPASWDASLEDGVLDLTAEPAASWVEEVDVVEAQEEPAPQDAPAAQTPAPNGAPGDFIDLGALVTDDGLRGGTRFRVREVSPTGDEDRDFAELLNQFKLKVQEHLPPEDAAAHYDLGLAFKEMGLLDEAISEFQIALRAGHMRMRVYEELGQCFLQKEEYNIAEKVLTRALDLKYEDELELLGVYYHLGRAYEALGRRDQARDAYERVLGMDINFEDVTDRLARL